MVTVPEVAFASFGVLVSVLFIELCIEHLSHDVSFPFVLEQVLHGVRLVFAPVLPLHSCELMVHQYWPIAGVQPSGGNARATKKCAIFHGHLQKGGVLSAWSSAATVPST